MQLIGVDVGGTFTDIVFSDTAANRTLTHKVASTPDDPSRAFMRGRWWRGCGTSTISRRPR